MAVPVPAHTRMLGEHVLEVLEHGIDALGNPLAYLHHILEDFVMPPLQPAYTHACRMTGHTLSRVSSATATAHATLSQHLDTSRALYTTHIHPTAGPLLTEMAGKALRMARPIQRWVDTHAVPHYARLEARFDAATSGHSKLEVALAAAFALLLLYVLAQWAAAAAARARRVSMTQRMFSLLKRLPGIRGVVAAEQAKVFAAMREDVRKRDPDAAPLLRLPEWGIDPDSLVAELEARAANDFRFADGASTATGSIYMTGAAHRDVLNDAYCLFSQTNPLHPAQFPSIRRMEAEVIAMTASLVGGGPDGNPEVCGAMTSGGTESILSAMLSSLAFQRENRGIVNPEILIADSAHAAYFKAASYSGAKLVIVKVSQRTFELTAADVARHLTRLTAVVVTSAVSYPHGTLDQVVEIAALCRSHSVLVHVDACLGGFVLPFLPGLGRAVRPWNFSVPGVTSMSIDTHKYGQAHKGTSVVLYSNAALRRSQYTTVTEWTGGLYISPGISGSRSGALIATAWAAMRHLGHEGYSTAAADMMAAADRLIDCITSIPELRLCGTPAMCNVAFMSTRASFNVLELNDLLAKKDWDFAVLIKPPALHFCFTHQHAAIADRMCTDLLAACEALRRRQGPPMAGGKAKLYGMSSTLPDRGALGDILLGYQDIMLTP